MVPILLSMQIYSMVLCSHGKVGNVLLGEHTKIHVFYLIRSNALFEEIVIYGCDVLWLMYINPIYSGYCDAYVVYIFPC